MSYKSDVCLCLTQDATNLLKAELQEDYVSPEMQQQIQDLFSIADTHLIDHKSGAQIWVWNGVKWYNTNPVIMSVYDILDHLEDLMEDEQDGDDYRYRLIRIGQEFDDIESKGEFWDNPFHLELIQMFTFTKPNPTYMAYPEQPKRIFVTRQ